MPRTLLTLTAIVLCLTPGAAAWPWDPVEIRVHETRVGDLSRYEDRLGGEAAEAATLTLVEGPARAMDKYGDERATLAFRSDVFREGELLRSERCHVMPGRSEVVRRDLLAGDPGGRTSGSRDPDNALLGSGWTEEKVLGMTTFNGRCTTGEGFSGRLFREGHTISIGELYPGENVPDVRSRPATTTSFEGRDALKFLFGAEEIRTIMAGMDGAVELPEDAAFDVVFADGLPGPVRVRFGTATEFEEQVLTGFTPGEGGVLDRSGEARLPEKNPNVDFAPFDPLSFDDKGLALPLPYAEAFAAMVSDPQSGARAWLDLHPDAVLRTATYEPGAPANAVGLTSRGKWMLSFQAGTQAVAWAIRADDTASTPLGSLALPAPRYNVTSLGEQESSRVVTAWPVEVIRTSDAVALARAAGVDPIPRVSYTLVQSGIAVHPWLDLTEIDPNGGDQDARAVTIDLSIGALDAVHAASLRSEDAAVGLLAPGSARGFAPPARAGLASLPAPSAIAAGAAALTGAGLLGLLLKFLVAPLFTRLRRDRLLDNPVRARLYERIRAEPGVHRAELVDFAGIGEGATRHHLAQLVKHQLLVEMEIDGFVRYFAAGEVPPDVARRQSTLRAGSQRVVYELYALDPSITLRAAAVRLGLSAPTVHRAKKRLEKAGLLPAAPSAEVAEA